MITSFLITYSQQIIVHGLDHAHGAILCRNTDNHIEIDNHNDTYILLASYFDAIISFKMSGAS